MEKTYDWHIRYFSKKGGNISMDHLTDVNGKVKKRNATIASDFPLLRAKSLEPDEFDFEALRLARRVRRSFSFSHFPRASVIEMFIDVRPLAMTVNPRNLEPVNAVVVSSKNRRATRSNSVANVVILSPEEQAKLFPDTFEDEVKVPSSPNPFLEIGQITPDLSNSARLLPVSAPAVVNNFNRNRSIVSQRSSFAEDSSIPFVKHSHHRLSITTLDVGSVTAATPKSPSNMDLSPSLPHSRDSIFVTKKVTKVLGVTPAEMDMRKALHILGASSEDIDMARSKELAAIGKDRHHH